jgi:hypothetical protein
MEPRSSHTYSLHAIAALAGQGLAESLRLRDGGVLWCALLCPTLAENRQILQE